ADHEWVVVDPDSPLTQLNLLPLAPDAQTRYFPKGTFEAPGAERLAELAGIWAQQLTGLDERPRPTLWLPAEAPAWAAALRARPARPPPADHLAGPDRADGGAGRGRRAARRLRLLRPARRRGGRHARRDRLRPDRRRALLPPLVRLRPRAHQRRPPRPGRRRP